jgi:hypothetical protein
MQQRREYAVLQGEKNAAAEKICSFTEGEKYGGEKYLVIQGGGNEQRRESIYTWEEKGAEART